jgi:acetyltransferase
MVLSVRVDRDPVFGPVIRFGGGATACGVSGPIQVALPPLNLFLCRELIQRAGLVRDRSALDTTPGRDADTLVDILMRVSEMACELPEIEQLTIDPVLADEEGALAIDARLSLSPSPVKPGEYGHMAIHPYPPGLEYNLLTRDGVRLIVRPIRPEDATIEQRFVEGLSTQSKYFRFMYGMAHLPPAMLARFTQIDYDREMALVAVQDDGGPEASLKAVARYVGNPGSESCEFALVVADDMQRQSIGRQLLERLIELARHRGFREMEGEVLVQNRRMLELCRSLGFRVRRSLEDSEVMAVTLGL